MLTDYFSCFTLLNDYSIATAEETDSDASADETHKRVRTRILSTSWQIPDFLTPSELKANAEYIKEAMERPFEPQQDRSLASYFTKRQLYPSKKRKIKPAATAVAPNGDTAQGETTDAKSKPARKRTKKKQNTLDDILKEIQERPALPDSFLDDNKLPRTDDEDSDRENRNPIEPIQRKEAVKTVYKPSPQISEIKPKPTQAIKRPKEGIEASDESSEPSAKETTDGSSSEELEIEPKKPVKPKLQLRRLSNKRRKNQPSQESSSEPGTSPVKSKIIMPDARSRKVMESDSD